MAQHQLIPLQIGTDNPLALSIERKLKKVPYQSTTTKREITISRIPSHIRGRNTNFYQPQIISIGPYHRDCGDVKCMETLKLRYVGKILNENPDVTLIDYLEELRKLESAARRCYNEIIEMNSDEFVEMLLYDACSIIQLVVNWRILDFDFSWNIPLIKSDLLMLENQIPFFVLQRVFDLYTSSKDDTPNIGNFTSEFTTFDKQSLPFVLVKFLMYESEALSIPEGDNSYDHLLDLYYQCYMRAQMFATKPMHKSPLLLSNIESSPWHIPNATKIQEEGITFPPILSIKRIIMHRHLDMIEKRKPRMIPCATELQEAGITFKKAEAKSIFGIHFSHGLLMIPYTLVEEATRPQIMNLIAFEQCNGKKHKPLTSYAVFMDCIVKTPRDVLILQKNGIIENKLANEKAAAEFFNQLRYCSYPDYDEHHLADLFKEVKNYCNSPRAKLYRYYFSNPWSVISFIAAVVLLLLTSLQIMYSVVPYYHPPH